MGGQYPTALRIPLNGPLNAFKCGPLCFILAPILMGPCPILGYFSNWGPTRWLRPGASYPPPLCFPSWRPCNWYYLYNHGWRYHFCQAFKIWWGNELCAPKVLWSRTERSSTAVKKFAEYFFCALCKCKNLPLVGLAAFEAIMQIIKNFSLNCSNWQCRRFIEDILGSFFGHSVSLWRFCILYFI